MALLELLFLLVQRFQFGIRGAERLRRGIGEEVVANFLGLRRRALAEHAGNDDASRIVNREIGDLPGLEHAAVDPQVVDLPEERRAEAPAADRQRRIAGHRPRQRVADHVDERRLAVDVQACPCRLAGSIVGQRHVVPVAEPESLTSPQLDRAGGRVRGQRGRQPPGPSLNPDEQNVVEPQLVAAPPGVLQFLDHLRSADCRAVSPRRRSRTGPSDRTVRHRRS